MHCKTVTKQDVKSGLIATHKGSLSPAHYPLGSTESRAMARAMAEKLGAEMTPQEGDVLVEMGPEDVSLFHALRRRVENRKESDLKRIPGIPMFFFSIPDEYLYGANM